MSIPQCIGHIILTRRGSEEFPYWEPFKRTTLPMMWESQESAEYELEQIQLNYPGHKFILGKIIADPNKR